MADNLRVPSVNICIVAHILLQCVGKITVCWNLKLVRVLHIKEHSLGNWRWDFVHKFLASSTETEHFTKTFTSDFGSCPVLVHQNSIVIEGNLKVFKWDEEFTVISNCWSCLCSPCVSPLGIVISEWSLIVLWAPWISHMYKLWSTIKLDSSEQWVSMTCIKGSMCSFTTSCHSVSFFVSFSHNTVEIFSWLVDGIVSSNGHACKHSQCNTWESTIKLWEVCIELSKGFLKDCLPPSSVWWHLSILWSLYTIVSVAWVCSHIIWDLVVDGDFNWFTQSVECDLEDACTVIVFIGEEIHNPIWMFSQSRCWCKEPAIT